MRDTLDKVEMEKTVTLSPEIENKNDKGMEKDAEKLVTSMDKRNKDLDVVTHLSDEYVKENNIEACGPPNLFPEELALVDTVFKIARAHFVGHMADDEGGLLALIDLKNKIKSLA